MAKYDPLREHLRLDGSRRITMTFEQIGRLVGGLPRSAYEHQAWWGNESDVRHVQKHAWHGAGYRVASFDQAAKRVTFEKR
jgi:putative restriction endonuclease